MLVHWCASVILLCGLAFAQEDAGEFVIPIRDFVRGPQLTQAQKDNIVILHNKLRGQQGASNMKQMVNCFVKLIKINNRSF
jgi:hypothetical protein